MATKHRGKAAQAKHAAKLGEKITRARANFNPESATREAEANHEYVIEQARLRRPAHRPPVLPEGCRRVTVNLTPAEIETARKLGQGNLSAGVRKALSPDENTDSRAPAGHQTHRKP
jgi:hypothetical protein